MRPDTFLTTAVVSYAMWGNGLASDSVARHTAATPLHAFAFDTPVVEEEIETSQQKLSLLAREWGEIGEQCATLTTEKMPFVFHDEPEAEEGILFPSPQFLPVHGVAASREAPPLAFHDEAEGEDEILLPPPYRTPVSVKIAFSGTPAFVFHDEFEDEAF